MHVSLIYFEVITHVHTRVLSLIRWCWTNEAEADRRLHSPHSPHGPGSSPCHTVWGGRGPGLRSLLPRPPLLLPAGHGGAMCPDGGGSLWLHLHLHLPGGADQLRGSRVKWPCRTPWNPDLLMHSYCGVFSDHAVLRGHEVFIPHRNQATYKPTGSQFPFYIFYCINLCKEIQICDVWLIFYQHNLFHLNVSATGMLHDIKYWLKRPHGAFLSSVAGLQPGLERQGR